MDKTALIIIVAFIVSQAADVWTTARALNSGQGKEGNPAMAWLIGKLGLYPGLIVPKTISVGISIAAMYAYPAAMIWVLAAITAGYVYIAYRNYRIVE